MLEMLDSMRNPSYCSFVSKQIDEERAKNKSLKSRAAQLERQIKVLIDDSVTLLKARIAELGMAAANPEDLLNRAKEIVWRHKELQAHVSALQQTVTTEEQEQERLIRRRKTEIVAKYNATRNNGHLNGTMDASQISQDFILREISQTLAQRKKLHVQVSKLENELSSLESEAGATSPPGGKRANCTTGMDSKRSPAAVNASLSKSRHRSRNQEWPAVPDVGKIEEKNPELLAMKILETGRQIEAGRIPVLPPGTEVRCVEVRGNNTRVEYTPLPRHHSGGRDQRHHHQPTAPPTSQQYYARYSAVHQQKENNNRLVLLPQRYSSANSSSTAGGSALSIKETTSGSDRSQQNLSTYQSLKNSMEAGNNCSKSAHAPDQEDRLKLIITNVLNEDSSKGDSYKRQAHSYHPYRKEEGASLRDEHGVEIMVREERRLLLDPRMVGAQQPDYTQVSPAKLALRRHLSQEKLAALESNINFSSSGTKGGGSNPSRSSSTSSADLVFVDTPGDSQQSQTNNSSSSNSSNKLPSHRLLLGDKLAERGLEVIPTGPPPTPPTTSPTLVTPPCQQPSTTPVDMTVSGSNKSISPRPPSGGCGVVPRPTYSPVSRPSSTDANYSRSPRIPEDTNSNSSTPTPVTASQPPVNSNGSNKPLMPPPSPGRDGLEARLAQIHQNRRTSSPAVSSSSTSSSPSAAVITSAIAAAANKYGRNTNSSPSLQQQQPQPSNQRPEAPPPVEGLAATLHARFLQQKHKLPPGTIKVEPPEDPPVEVTKRKRPPTPLSPTASKKLIICTSTGTDSVTTSSGSTTSPTITCACVTTATDTTTTTAASSSVDSKTSSSASATLAAISAAAVSYSKPSGASASQADVKPPVHVSPTKTKPPQQQQQHPPHSLMYSLPPPPPAPTMSSSHLKMEDQIDHKPDPSGLIPRPESPQLQSWQQQINSGFDKLMSFAAEVDKRRKSTETSSPRQDSHHLTPSTSSTSSVPSTSYAPPPFGSSYGNGPTSGSVPGTNGGISSPVNATANHHPMDRRANNVGGLPGRLMESSRIGGHYSPHSPHSLLPPLTSPQGRPPTPQSPHIPLRTPPITSPPPTPSPDLRCDSINSRLPSPPPQPSFYDHHFKKKYYHKERASPSDIEQHSISRGPPNALKAVDRMSPQQQMELHHHHQQQLQAKFRPKGKDWQWRNSREIHHPQHNNSVAAHHYHYQQRALHHPQQQPYPHHSGRQMFQQPPDMGRNKTSNLPPNNYYNHA